MTISLSKEKRSQLAKVTALAREHAESASKAALENLAVHESKPRGHMKDDAKKLRNRLRARGRALGDVLESDKSQGIGRLVEMVAYENWHRLLFTRFLTENNFLITDQAHGSVPITLADCDELAKELGARDGQELACRFARGLLPGVFRADDPVLELRLSIDDEVKLRGLLQNLSGDIFQADDSLGWTYQFWQDQRKEAINKSGVKIGANELSPVTQLFTEDYMVEFLLHNTLGAWWAGKRGAIVAESEQQARDQVALVSKDGIAIEWKYLRFIQDEKTKTWVPAAGNFDGWPKKVKEITFLDPCMGSGHFLVFALPILARLYIEEEGLSAKEAIYATLENNIHGLELDERCSQIAAFNLALTAWKLGGFQPLPELNLACSGIAPHATKDEWGGLAGNDTKLINGMERLHDLFKDAPVLGSLINPRISAEDMYVADFHELQPLLEKALSREAKDDTAHEMAVTASGLAKAAEILAGQFTLVATNVPYLGRGKQNDGLKDYCDSVHPKAKADLATCFVERCFAFCSSGASTALVTPQNWLFLGTYSALRCGLLKDKLWNIVAKLGPGAFETIGGEVVNVVLLTTSNVTPDEDSHIGGLDATLVGTPSEKAAILFGNTVKVVTQSGQARNPDARITLEEPRNLPLLEKLASGLQGISPADFPHYGRCFWEVNAKGDWHFWQSTIDETCEFGGRELVLWWNQDLKDAVESGQAYIRGNDGWGHWGVVVRQMSTLPATIYTGEKFDTNCAVIVPKDRKTLPAIWAYCASEEYRRDVRQIDQKLNVTNATLVKVPFDLAHWQKVAAEKYPHGLPKPFSSDPTQWLFNGHPNQKVAEASSLCSSNKTQEDSTTLQVAVARLLGYQWPRQTGSSFPDCPELGPDGLEEFADTDGIVCLQPLRGEQPAAHRLREILNHSFSEKGKASYDEKKLIASSGLKGSKATNLEDWLRDEFFEQHCALFHHRPFIWHIWDGRKDGFHALLNYHKLDHEILKKLTYSHLGDWIRQQNDDAKADKPGAAERLGAAEALQKELEFILKGQPPYDIFVRWKSLQQQAKGWYPDLNDGVRMNIRPFMQALDMGKKGAGILRSKPNIKWDKDRGKEPERDKREFPWFWCDDEPEEDPKPGSVFVGNRFNNVHLSLEFKIKAKETK